MGSIRKNILTLALSIAVAIAFAEVGLRAWGISYPEFYRLDSRFGWSPRPGMEGIHAMEGRTRIKINAEGFRDVDHETAKPAGVFRWRCWVIPSPRPGKSPSRTPTGR